MPNDPPAKPSRILVPTDFSEAAEAAKMYALMIAEGFGATLHILHVLPESGDFGEGLDAAQMSELMEHARRGAHQRLDHLLAPHERESVRAQLALEFGRPTAKIVDYARDNAIDLIVIGSHGRNAIDKWWFGSVAQGVLLRAACPVIMVRPRPEVPR
ncbi:MAG: universal stress protein [Acidobacteria bacterium]|nr:MAG: universal stress protein [Acidobacteriota bacterium]